MLNILLQDNVVYIKKVGNMLNNKEKKELKQFSIKTHSNCITYLQRIIVTSELCLLRLKKYNSQTKAILEQNGENCKITHEIYEIEKDKTNSIMCYLLNILGDAQASSISYFKYRKLAEKLIKQNVEGVALVPLTEEIKHLMQEFNKLRNWQNHILESLLTSEIELTKEGKLLPHTVNPIVLNIRLYVTYDYFKDLYDSNVGFYDAARKIVQICKKDYSLLIGESVRIAKEYKEIPADVDSLDAVKLSSHVQGLKGQTE